MKESIEHLASIVQKLRNGTLRPSERTCVEKPGLVPGGYIPQCFMTEAEHIKAQAGITGQEEIAGLSTVQTAGLLLLSDWRELVLRATHDGRIEHLRSGKLDHGSAPYGYVYVPKWRNGWGFKIHPKRAQVVRDIFNWRRGDMQIYRIVLRLNESGIPSARGDVGVHE